MAGLDVSFATLLVLLNCTMHLATSLSLQHSVYPPDLTSPFAAINSNLLTCMADHRAMAILEFVGVLLRIWLA